MDDYEEDCHEDLDIDDLDEWVMDCGDPNCCMPGPHFRSECHTPDMIEAQARQAERAGKRCPDGDWNGDKEPGGMDCQDCGCIFISNDGRPLCKVCHDAHSSETVNLNHEAPNPTPLPLPERLRDLPSPPDRLRHRCYRDCGRGHCRGRRGAGEQVLGDWGRDYGAGVCEVV